MEKVRNVAGEIYAFMDKYENDSFIAMTSYIRKVLQPNLIKYMQRQKNPDFLFAKSPENKNLLTYAIEFELEDFLVEVLHKFPEVCKYTDKNGRNLVCRAARHGCEEIVFAAFDSDREDIQNLVFQKDYRNCSAGGYVMNRYRNAPAVKEKPQKVEIKEPESGQLFVN